MNRNIKLIACGVLENELQAAAEELNISISADYLEAGLHEQPDRLKRELQQAVDRVTACPPEQGGSWDAIVIGYGLCGRGTVGLRAGSIPLIIPRVHDCISLFLGSKEIYNRQFKQNPGTFYMTDGWYEHKTQPMSIKKKQGRLEGNWDISAGFDAMKKKYGRGNAEEIYNFLNSWKRNYSRSVYIDTGTGDGSLYESYTRDLASELGWDYEKIDGSPELFNSMLTAGVTDENILVVPPFGITAYDPVARGLYAYNPEAGAPSVWDRSLPAGREVDSMDTAGRRDGLGLGIDAGGTYTDAVIYDFKSKKVLSKAKAPTTKWNFTIGITEALGKLPAEQLSMVSITVVSTTLATNAIVEGRGRKTGLLLMPLGNVAEKQLLHSPCRIVGGRLSIGGEELEPVSEEEIRRAARDFIDANAIEAFAVSGYGSTINPVHELQIKRIIEDETGLGVCCGHELSDTLNFFVRANTAVLNAGIIPLIEQFIQELEKALDDLDVEGSLMIVRGDGSLMSRAKAVSHPIETTLSGPAASIAGARFLSGLNDAVIIDVGGTTSDIGLISGGKIRLASEGARVGRWHTHVKAVDMSTLGAGGDSRILIENHELKAGPRRAVPFAQLPGHEGWETAVSFIEQLHTDYFYSTASMEILALTGRKAGRPLTGGESRIVSLLKQRPYSLKELASVLAGGLWNILEVSDLEHSAIVQRFSLTPTDLFTASGLTTLWPAELPLRILRLYAVIWGEEMDEFSNEVLETISDNLLQTLVLQELDVPGEDSARVTAAPAFKSLLRNIKEGGRALSFTPSINTPLVGVGAAAGWLLEKTARLLGAELVLPEYGDVANAVGAVCSMVRVSRSASVNPTPGGGFSIAGLDMQAEFDDFHEACDCLEHYIPEIIRRDAKAAGTDERQIFWRAENRMTSLGDGNTLFLGRDYTVEIKGLPI
ncbi:MAG: DUF1638 domain-containing protein [Spirochaetales bacterium]|nr:DUF1638 domain-containing protein [Spirochaetales bacterium]